MDTIQLATPCKTLRFVTNLSCHHRSCRSPCPRHVYPGHLSSPGLYHRGSSNGRGRVDHSPDRGGHLFSESSPHDHLGGVGLENGPHDEGTAPADHLDHGHVRNRIAKMQTGEYGPTARDMSLIPTYHQDGGGTSIFSISSLPIRLLCIS